MRRRTFLRSVVAGGALIALPTSKLLLPVSALAATRSRDAFRATTEAEVLRSLFGTASTTRSDAVKIEAPLLSAAGKPVPIEVRCNLEGADLIAIVTRNNQYLLNSLLHLEGADPYCRTRIRVERDSPVTAYVKAGDSVYFAIAQIRFTHGGYGAG